MLSLFYSFLKYSVNIINFVLWLLGLGVVAIMIWVMHDSDLYQQTMSMSGSLDYMIDNLVNQNGDTMDVTKCSVMAKETVDEAVTHIVHKVCNNLNKIIF
eukprot:GFUD01118146.1.p1 GENE.GFUD01118146.1~~GFUD01118146.1.p1  ORF type:complete len:100 (-),score=23.88 GFUD01118146.1:235-534(-)